MKKVITYIDLEPVVTLIGSQARLAELLGIERANVTAWSKAGYIPVKHTKAVIAEVKKRKREIDRAYKKVMK